MPSISQLLDTAANLSIKKKFQKPYVAPPIDSAWISTRCPGIPSSIEALCLLVEQGKAEQKGWKYGLEFTGLTDESIWQIYEHWTLGRIHPMLKDYREKKFGVDNVIATP